MLDPADRLPETTADVLSRLRSGTGIVLDDTGSPIPGSAIESLWASLANRIGDLDLGSDDTVAVCIPDGPLSLLATLSITSVARCAPLSPRLTEAELLRELSDLGARAAVVPAGSDAPLASAARKIGLPTIEVALAAASHPPLWLDLPKPLPSAVALLLRTSGTTGTPKTVPLTHRNILSSSGAVGAALGLGPADRLLGVMPLFHIHGLITAIAALTSGGSVVSTSGFDPRRILTWLAELDPSWYSAVPTIHQSVLREASAATAPVDHSLRLVRSSSAALPVSVLLQLESVFNVTVVEAYGMTETAHQIASNPTSRDHRRAGSVGLPAGAEVALLTDGAVSTTPGQPGEVVIRGPGVMDGYLDNPSANSAAFVEGWFRTGDEGMLDPAGYLHLTARLKELINKGGEMIAPREVDDALLSHPAVLQAATFALPHPTYGEEVAAAVVLDPAVPTTPLELQHHVAQRLADFKVPRKIVPVERIPTGPTGKLQRIGLAQQLGLLAPHHPRAERAPRSPLEAALTGIWCELLAVEDVDPDEDFFALGGDSLQAMQMLTHIAEVFDVEIGIERLFGGGATIRAIAPEIQRSRSTGRPTRIEPARPSSGDGLTPAERRILFLSDLDPDRPVYNVSLAFRLPSGTTPIAIERALALVVARHEALRTVFPRAGGMRRRVILTPTAVPLEIATARGPLGDEVNPVSRAFVRKLFDLDTGPLLRALLLEATDGTALVLAFHHSVVDGWSCNVIDRDLRAALRSEPYASDSVQVREVATRLDAPACDDDVAYWTEAMDSAPAMLSIPTDWPRPPSLRFDGDRVQWTIDAPTAGALKALARRSGATIFMVILAALDVALARYSAQDDIVVGVPFAGRNVPGLDGSVGLFVNTLPIRVHIDSGSTFEQLLVDIVRPACEGGLAHQRMAYEQLVAMIAPDRLRNVNPLFQVLAQMRPANRDGEALERLEIWAGTAKLDLALEAAEREGELRFSLEYNTELFEPATAHRLAAMIDRCLQAAALHPEQRIADVQLSSPEERAWTLEVGTGPEPTLLAKSNVGDVVAASAARWPDRVAVRCGPSSLTYAELAVAMDRIASGLLERVASGSAIGLLLDRDLMLLPTVLAVLRAGCAYVPLDPRWPAARLQSVLDGASLSLVVRSQGLDIRQAGSVLLSELLGGADPNGKLPEVATDDLAYVIHTSGSTGQPKGVEVTHGAVLNLIAWAGDTFSRDELARVLASTSLTFDISVFEMFAPLAFGGSIDVVHDALALSATQPAITLLNTVPSVCTEIVRLGALPPTAATVCLVGEVLETGLIDALANTAGVERVVNLYGPTETTVYSTMWDVALPWQGDQVPIGRPIHGTRTVVLDAANRLAPVGAAGELFIGGRGLARGYRGRDDLTAERFIYAEDPSLEGKRLYRTGDRVRLLPSGDLAFLGRVDDQIKLRGHRIELGEVETHLRQIVGVREAAVIVAGEGAMRRLVAYVAGADIDPAEIIRRCGATLPSYMVPSAVLVLPSLPRSSSGKLDRRSLPRADVVRRDERRPEPAETPEEHQLLEIWRALLPDVDFGVGDDFFEVGGHSLLAACMVAEAEERAGLVIALSSLFDGEATVRRLTAIAVPSHGLQRSQLVPVVTEGSQLPLFVMCADESSLLALRAFPATLGTGRPLYGLLPRRDGRRFDPATTVEQLAAELRRAVQSVSPEGPYLLAGHSFGGVIAYELGVQLQREGATVAFIGLLDSVSGDAMRRGIWRRRARKLIKAGPVRGAKKVVHFAQKVLATSSARPIASVADWEVDLEGVYRILRAYREPGFAGRVDLYLTEELTTALAQPVLGWDRVGIEHLVSHEVPGGHLSMLQQPNIEELGRTIRRRIDEIGP